MPPIADVFTGTRAGFEDAHRYVTADQVRGRSEAYWAGSDNGDRQVFTHGSSPPIFPETSKY
jgi:hypothetical protein